MSPTSYQAALSRDINKFQNGGEGGIRTPAPVARPPGFQDQSLQPDLGTSPQLVPKAGLEPARDLTPAGF